MSELEKMIEELREKREIMSDGDSRLICELLEMLEEYRKLINFYDKGLRQIRPDIEDRYFERIETLAKKVREM